MKPAPPVTNAFIGSFSLRRRLTPLSSRRGGEADAEPGRGIQRDSGHEALSAPDAHRRQDREGGYGSRWGVGADAH